MAVYLSDGAAPDAPVSPDASAEAVDWFRARVPVRPELWRVLDAKAQRRAFTVAGATELDLVTQVWRAIDRAIAQGTDFRAFRDAVGSALARDWGGAAPGRLETVFRNNMQLAYAAGRYAQMTEPDIIADRPYWRFEAILDSRTTPICRPLDGMTLLASDPYWKSHYPPLHHQCRSGVTTLSEEQARGAHTAVPASDAPQTGWGAFPDLTEWSLDLADYPPQLRAAYERKHANNED